MTSATCTTWPSSTPTPTAASPGRQPEPVYYDFSAADDKGTQDQAACAKWTQDNKVFAIVQVDDILRACAEKTGAVSLAGCDGTAATFQRFPHFIDPYCMRLDRLGTVTTNGLAHAKYFAGTFGFVTWDDAKYKDAYQRGYVPAFRANHVTVKDTAFIGVPQQVGAIGDMTAAVSSAVTKFRSQGIDHVIIQDGPAGVFSGAGLTLEWMNQAKSQRYYPRYGQNAQNAPGWDVLPADQMDKAIAIMDTDYDAKYDQGWHANKTREKCFKIMADAGYPVRSSNENDEGIAAQACDAIFFTQLVMNKATSLTADGFVQTVEALGRDFPSAFVYGTEFKPGQHDGSAKVRQAEYFQSCKCLKYSGAPYSLPVSATLRVPFGPERTRSVALNGVVGRRGATMAAMAKRASAAPPAVEPVSSTLRALIERLHPALLDVVAAPRGLDVEVGDPVLLDPAESLPPTEGGVVLAIGLDTDRARVALMRQAADAGAAAVVVKLATPADESVRVAAEDTGVALLVAPPALSWGQLYTLLLTAATRSPTAGPGLPEAPLGDLFALANAVAAVVGGATTIEDPNNRVLAYSNLDHPIDIPRQETILGRQVPSAWIQRLHDAGAFRRLWNTDEVVRIADFVGDDVEYLPRIAVAVRAGGELLGSIWVIEGAQPLGPDAERTLRDAADIAALHLLRHRAATDVDRQRRAEALLALLEGSDRGELAADVLDIEPGRPTAVVAFDIGGEGDATAVVAAERVADLAAVYCESYRRQAACAATGSRVYVLVPVDADLDPEPAVSLAAAIVDRAGQALRLTLRAGVGSAVGVLDAVVRSRREADEVLGVLAGREDQQVATIDAVRPQVILRRLRDVAARAPELATGRVAALAEQDAAKGTAWVQTLRAYFDAFGDMASAAAAVNVHPNTFRYRLRRITEVFGLDLADPDERLVAELQLRFLD